MKCENLKVIVNGTSNRMIQKQMEIRNYKMDFKK